MDIGGTVKHWNPALLELISLRTPIKGDLVERNRYDWSWGEQDGGAGHVGTVVDGVTEASWLRVQWTGGGQNNYRYGADGKYDVKLAVSRGCGPACSLSHSSDGLCLVCGDNWGPHSDHNCNKDGFKGRRGAWIVSTALQVGSKVKLSGSFEGVSDAAKGPLAVGDAGEIIEIGSTGRRRVEAKTGRKVGKVWWYDIAALELVGSSTAPTILQPAVVASTSKGCDASCSANHSSDGLCLVCGDKWGPHSGHNCNKDGFKGRRGAWIVASALTGSDAHTGFMVCGCAHQSGKERHPIDSSRHHLDGSCKWDCCGQSWSAESCTAARSTSLRIHSGVCKKRKSAHKAA